MSHRFDAIVVGAGPNGLAAAIELARRGKSVLLREAAERVGGSCTSDSLTLPGFTHDPCSTVIAFACASPFLRSVPLAAFNVEFVCPECPVGHPFDDGSAAIMHRSVDTTAAALGPDATAYRALFAPFLGNCWEKLAPAALDLMRLRHPVLMARFGLKALRSARGLVDAHFRTQHARGLFAGIAAHAILPFDRTASASFGLMLALAAHADGWPIVRGGSQRLADGLASYFRSLGGVIETSSPVKSFEELPPADAILCDVTPRQLVRLAGNRLPAGYRRRLGRFRHGPAAFKLDWALDGAVPWKARDLLRCGTIHLGGTFEEIAEAELAVWQGREPERPYVLVVQPTLFDPSRAPPGKHTLWAYCHVPNGSRLDMTTRIEDQIERFAPGFRARILARHVTTPADFEARNPNLIGGDIAGGAQNFAQVLARPVKSLNPYATPLPGLYLCSSSTPPGGGVHGMCGAHAARAALKQLGRGA